MLSKLTIVSFNIWDLPLSFDWGRRKRILKIAEYLKSLDADIICLQESWDAVHRRLIHEQLGSAYHTLSSKPRRRHLLYRVSNTSGGLFTLAKFPISSEHFTPFSRLNNSITEMLGNKGILETTIITDQGSMRVLNTHLQANQGSKIPWLDLGSWIRFKQFKKVLAQAGSNSQPMILAGDFNEHAIIKQERLAHLLNKSGFIDPMFGQETMMTFRLENALVDTPRERDIFGGSQQFDNILVRSLDSLGFSVQSYKPAYLKPELSDHDPIVLILSSEK